MYIYKIYIRDTKLHINELKNIICIFMAHILIKNKIVCISIFLNLCIYKKNYSIDLLMFQVTNDAGIKRESS